MKLIRPLIGIVIFLVIWHVASKDNHILVPPLLDILAEYLNLIRKGVMLEDIVASVLRIFIGILISTFIACLMGTFAFFWRPFSDYIYGLVELIRPIPPIAWTPIAIIAFGIGDLPAISIVVIGTLFPIWLGIKQGLDNVKESHTMAAGSLGASKFLMFSDVIIPSVLPYFLHGLRISVGLGWFCVIAAEMMGASSGLGHGVQLFSLNIEMPKVYCYLATIGALGLLSNYLAQSAIKSLIGWSYET